MVIVSKGVERETRVWSRDLMSKEKVLSLWAVGSLVIGRPTAHTHDGTKSPNWLRGSGRSWRLWLWLVGGRERR